MLRNYQPPSYGGEIFPILAIVVDPLGTGVQFQITTQVRGWEDAE